jgi:hypothetical protein
LPRFLAVAVLALLLAGTASFAVIAGSASNRSTTGSEPLMAVPPLPGRIIAEADDGGLSLSQPDGTHVAGLHLRPFTAGYQPLFIDQGGTVIGLQRSGGVDLSSLSLALNPRWTIVSPDPLTNGGRDLIVKAETKWRGSTSMALVATFDNRRVADLGMADDAAGDPQALGAFVTVPLVVQPAVAGVQNGINGLVDDRVELRDVGRSPIVLATAGELERDLGMVAVGPVNLAVYPDGNGQKVAVEVNPIGGGLSNSGVVVLNRRGRVLGTIERDQGPTEYTTPYWSPDDTALAYQTFSSVGTSLAVVNQRYQVATQSLESTTSVDGCTWSPDSAWVVCLAVSPYTDNWLIANNDEALTPIYSVPARNRPVVWLAAGA